MTNRRTAELMGDPPFRSAAIADVLADAAAVAAEHPELLLAPPTTERKGANLGHRRTHSEAQRARTRGLQERAQTLWADGCSVGLIASILDLSLATAYDYVHRPEEE